MQTVYNDSQAIGRVGALADSSDHDNVSKVASVAIPAGCMAVRDADDLKAKLPTSAAEVAAALLSGGVAVATHAMVSDPEVDVPTFPIGKEVALMRKGRLFVKVEEAVTQGDQAYVRYANGIAVTDGTQDQKGAFRKSYDGTAQVDTITPTAVNATVYSMSIQDADGKVIGSAEYTSDGSATATEIADGLRAALGTVPGVTVGGTATITLTSSVAGKGFTTNVSAGLAVVNTTANAASAAPAAGCYYKSSASAGELAVLEVNLGGK